MLDPQGRQDILDTVTRLKKERNMTVVWITHYMDEAEYCDRASIMVDGQIRALGTPAELKKKFGRADMDGVFKDLARGAQRKGA